MHYNYFKCNCFIYTLLYAVYNVITHAYIPDEYVPQILNINNTGQKLYQDYVSERINGNVSLWAPVKKENNLMYMSGNKKHTVKVRDKTVDLKEPKDLYGRLMVLAHSNRDIDQSDHEFTLTPRSLFSPDAQCCHAVTSPNLSTDKTGECSHSVCP